MTHQESLLLAKKLNEAHNKLMEARFLLDDVWKSIDFDGDKIEKNLEMAMGLIFPIERKVSKIKAEITKLGHENKKGMV